MMETPVSATVPLQVLTDAVQDLSLARTLDQIMAIVRTAARRLTAADGATFVLRDGDRCFYADEDAISPLWKGGRFPMSACISGWVMLNRRPAAIADIYADPRIPADAYRPTFVKSLAMVPIRSKSPIGAIGNYWARHHEATPAEIRLLQALADSASAAIEHAQLREDLDRRSRERDERGIFADSVSHDLRAPLGRIASFAKLLAEDYGAGLDEAGRMCVDRIGRTAEQMVGTMDSLLQLSRVEHRNLRVEEVDLGGLAREICADFRAEDPARAVDFKLEPCPPARGDEGFVRVILENLLRNAWKFSAKADRAVIEFGAREESGRRFYFVRDNGAGFDRAAVDVFAPFQRAHSEREFAGTGIGLAIVRKAVERHGGEIRAESEPGRGAVFSFTLG